MQRSTLCNGVINHCWIAGPVVCFGYTRQLAISVKCLYLQKNNTCSISSVLIFSKSFKVISGCQRIYLTCCLMTSLKETSLLVLPGSILPHPYLRLPNRVLEKSRKAISMMFMWMLYFMRPDFFFSSLDL